MSPVSRFQEAKAAAAPTRAQAALQAHAQRPGLRWPRAVAWALLQSQLLLLGLVSLATNILAMPLLWLMPRNAAKHFGRAFIAYGYRSCFATAHVTGLASIDTRALRALAREPGLIIVANHPSMMDAMLIVSRLPWSACIMKASLLRNPFLSAGARLARYIPNDTAHGMVRLAVEDLRSGGQLVIFPEGTRTTSAPLNPLQASFALIAKRAQAPIQTVIIESSSPYLQKGWPLWRLPPTPIGFRLRLGQRFAPRDDYQGLTEQVESYFRQELENT